jgi:hypothetical protein
VVTARRSRAARDEVRRENPAGVACGRGEGTSGAADWLKENGWGCVPEVGVMGDVVEMVGRGGRLWAEGLVTGDDLLLSSPFTVVVRGERMLLSRLAVLLREGGFAAGIIEADPRRTSFSSRRPPWLLVAPVGDTIDTAGKLATLPLRADDQLPSGLVSILRSRGGEKHDGSALPADDDNRRLSPATPRLSLRRANALASPS